MNAENKEESSILTELTAEIVAAYISNNPVASGALSDLISGVHDSLKALQHPVEKVEERPEAAVSVRKSVKPDHIVCLEDGLTFKSLKRHLQAHHGLTPQQYRERWNLPADYPMVAPEYAAKRSKLAKDLGLGRARGSRKNGKG